MVEGYAAEALLTEDNAVRGLQLRNASEATARPVIIACRAVVLATYGMALGSGLGQVAGKVFRIGHLGDFDDLSLVAALAGVELSLGVADVPHKEGGVSAALAVLAAAR